jgi:serine protease Do
MKNILAELSREMEDIIQRNEQSIVRVEGDESRYPSSGFFFNDEGLAVTSYHTAARAGKLTVTLDDGTEHEAELIGGDDRYDLALLRFEARGKVPQFSTGEELKAGHFVCALGRPGRVVRAAFGMVSLRSESYRTWRGGDLSYYIEVDGSLPGGFSGGPLVGGDGMVLGMNTSVPRGRGMTVPFADLEKSVRLIIDSGGVKRYYLGVNVEPVRLPSGVLEEKEVPATGLLVVEVEEGSPAAKTPVFLGDTFVSINEMRMRNINDLFGLLGSADEGLTFTARVLRGGKIIDVVISPELR